MDISSFSIIWYKQIRKIGIEVFVLHSTEAQTEKQIKSKPYCVSFVLDTVCRITGLDWHDTSGNVKAWACSIYNGIQPHIYLLYTGEAKTATDQE